VESNELPPSADKDYSLRDFFIRDYSNRSKKHPKFQTFRKIRIYTRGT
jgi:hypothetical protein